MRNRSRMFLGRHIPIKKRRRRYYANYFILFFLFLQAFYAQKTILCENCLYVRGCVHVDYYTNKLIKCLDSIINTSFNYMTRQFKIKQNINGNKYAAHSNYLF